MKKLAGQSADLFRPLDDHGCLSGWYSRNDNTRPAKGAFGTGKSRRKFCPPRGIGCRESPPRPPDHQPSHEQPGEEPSRRRQTAATAQPLWGV